MTVTLANHELMYAEECRWRFPPSVLNGIRSQDDWLLVRKHVSCYPDRLAGVSDQIEQKIGEKVNSSYLYLRFCYIPSFPAYQQHGAVCCMVNRVWFGTQHQF